jgi:hypothetical protein
VAGSEDRRGVHGHRPGRFSAKVRGDKFQEITIQAFDQEHRIEGDLLAKLSGFPLASLQTTHEAGFERLGGHMVHFKLKKVALDKDKGLVETRIVLSVSKGKGPVVSEARETFLKATVPAAPAGDFLRVELRGKLKVHFDARREIGSADVTVSLPGSFGMLVLPKEPALRKAMKELDGQNVIVTGELPRAFPFL